MINNINIHWYNGLSKSKKAIILKYNPIYDYKLKGDRDTYKLYRYIYDKSKVDLISKHYSNKIIRDIPYQELKVVYPNNNYILKQDSLLIVPLMSKIVVPMYKMMSIVIAKNYREILVGTTYAKSNRTIKEVVESFDYVEGEVQVYKYGECDTGDLAIFPCTTYTVTKKQQKLLIQNGVEIIC